jgi:hypothetical protein
MAPSPNEADHKLSRSGLLMLALVFQTLFCRKPDLFKPVKAALFAALAIAACARIYALAAGAISI